MYNLQFFASKKGVGSTKNGRDSNPKFLGAKLADGQLALGGQIIYRQRGNRIYPGKNVGQGNDFTLYALKEGIVRYEGFKSNKKRVSIVLKDVDVANRVIRREKLDALATAKAAKPASVKKAVKAKVKN